MSAKRDGVLAAHKRPIYALVAAGAISSIGNSLTGLAVPWFVLETTGSASRTGLTGFFVVLPAVISGILGGPLIDRLGFKRASVLSDVASGVTVALIPLLYHTVGLAFWQLLALVFLGSILDTPGGTARQSMMPTLAQLAGMPLERSNSLAQSLSGVANLLGPVLAGGLIAAIGTSNVMWIDAATFAVCAVSVALMVPSGAIPRTPPTTGRQPGYFANISEGLRFIRREPVILAFVITAAILNATQTGRGLVALPVYAKEAFGSAVNLGLMFGASGAGSLVGSIVSAVLAARLPRRATLVVGLLLGGAPMWILATMPGVAVSVGVMAITGLAFAPVNVMIGTVFQERVPVDMRSRVFGTTGALTVIAGPLGVLATGFLVEGAGITFTLIVLASIFMLVSLTTAINPAFRDLGGVRTENDTHQTQTSEST